jgi:hypothetical protein
MSKVEYFFWLYLWLCHIYNVFSIVDFEQYDSSTLQLYKVPDIVHQVYDYQSPNFFLYLSIATIQRFHQPKRHILWVNDEGRFRKAHWESWQRSAQGSDKSWEKQLHSLIHTEKKLEIQFVTFPSHPPGNESIYVTNKAHKSDFVRMKALAEYGGIYIDTDAYILQSLDSLRLFPFTLAMDNLVNKRASHLPKRLNNGVIFSEKNSSFLNIWMKSYNNFRVDSFDYDSSVIPFHLAVEHPDLIHIEMNRISPISYSFHTSQFAEAVTCGIFIPPSSGNSSSSSDVLKRLAQSYPWAKKMSKISDNYYLKKELFAGDGDVKKGAIWYPKYKTSDKIYSFENTSPDYTMYEHLKQKFILHLTMSQVR